jgi:hypothetical protein
VNSTAVTNIGDPSRARLDYKISRTNVVDDKCIYQMIVMGLFDRGRVIFADPRYRFMGLGYGINIRVNHRFVITVMVGNHTLESKVNISIFVDDNCRPWYVPDFFNLGEMTKIKMIGDIVTQILSDNKLLAD